jgi:hypothetical protein
MDPDPAEVLDTAADACGWTLEDKLLVCLGYIAAEGRSIRIAFAAYVAVVQAEDKEWNVLPSLHTKEGATL